MMKFIKILAAVPAIGMLLASSPGFSEESETAAADFTICIEHNYEPAQSDCGRAQGYAAMGDTEKKGAELQAFMTIAE